ncbi:hypothetical protein [Streptomyces sp. WMMC940]|uniref:hypothetical protein n=1 Tax=Streptomyces sp. WMMC940 TaxID=3015153 RepID=UPI0022B72CEE|nr:hypothetical protein [Streptomyces sp. WMMC940]MCZ7462290.1 hypothetical protein [Streptomyces sp. WMMC940]
MSTPLTPPARALHRAGLIGALVTFACAVAFQILSAVHSDVHLQPTDAPLSPDAFLRPLNGSPDAVLLWMAFDTLFVVAYLTTFAAARALTVTRLLGTFSLAAMIAAGALDMVENAVLAVHAAQASVMEPVAAAPMTTLYVIAQLKTAAAATGIAFLALALPWRTRLLRAAIVAAGAFVLVTVAGVARPEQAALEALPILLLTGLLAAVFARRLRASAVAPAAVAEAA